MLVYSFPGNINATDCIIGRPCCSLPDLVLGKIMSLVTTNWFYYFYFLETLKNLLKKTGNKKAENIFRVNKKSNCMALVRTRSVIYYMFIFLASLLPCQISEHKPNTVSWLLLV